MKLWQSTWGSKDAKQSQLPRIFQYRYKIPMLAFKMVLLCIVLVFIILISDNAMHPRRNFVLQIGILSVVTLSSLSLGLWIAKVQIQAVKIGIQEQIYWKDTKPNRRARYLLFSVASAMVVITLIIRHLLWGTAADDNLFGGTFWVMLLSYHIGKDIFIIRWSLQCFRA